MSKKRFVLNDESVKNTYGFRVLTAGINLTRFNDNPVCLNNHSNSTKDVLGEWIALETKDGLLTAEPDFDTEDVEGKEVVRKVENGKIKGCSIGIIIDPDKMLLVNGELILSECELLEASIVAVPSNSKAIVLYSSEGVMLDETEVKTLCLSADKTNPKNNTDLNMKKINLGLLAFVALGFAQNTQSVEEPELEKAVLDLKAKADSSASELLRVKAELKAYQDAEKITNTQNIDTMVELAVKEGRITAEHSQTYKDLAAQNFDLASKTIASLPVKAELGADIHTPGGTTEPMTEEKFQTLSAEAQLSWKTANLDAYKKLFS